MSRGIRSQLAPKSLEFKASEFYISDKYATILSVISYPGAIMPGYLSTLTNIPGIKVVVKHIPVPFSVMSKMLNKQHPFYSISKTSENIYNFILRPDYNLHVMSSQGKFIKQ